MPRISPIILLCCAALLVCGCSKEPEIPPIDSIRTIHVSLNESENRAYWNYEGNISQENWPILLKHFSAVPYPNQALNWQGLAVIEIQTKDGDELSIEVYDTGDSSGCYKLDEYYVIDDEKQFAKDAKRFLTQDP
jgi:hypothetical protein